MLPDNYFASKVFDKLTLKINHKELNSRNSINLPFLTRYFNSKLNYSDSNMNQLGELEGYWTNTAPPSVSLLDATPENGPNYSKEVDLRRKNAVESDTDGEKFWTHQFIVPLDVGLSSLTKPLPKDCLFRLECELSKKCKSLMGAAPAVNGVIGELVGSTPLKLINPQLEVMFFYSDYFDNKLSQYKLSKTKWPFSMPFMQTELLSKDLDVHNVRIAHGNPRSQNRPFVNFVKVLCPGLFVSL